MLKWKLNHASASLHLSSCIAYFMYNMFCSSFCGGTWTCYLSYQSKVVSEYLYLIILDCLFWCIWQIKPLSVRYGLGISDHDSEGRLVTVEFDTFYLLCGYVPNSGDGLKRLVSDMAILVDPLLGSFFLYSYLRQI